MKLEVNLSVGVGTVRRVLFLGVTALVVGAGALAYAALPQYTDGSVLTAASLNSNFKALEDRIATLESKQNAAPAFLTASSGESKMLTANTDGPYSSMYLDLPAGTWLVQGQASLTSLVNQDAVRLAIYNDTASTVVSGSLGATGVVPAVTFTVAATTAPVLMTVSATTRLRLYGYRNGSSTLAFGTAYGSTGALSAGMSSNTQRITALAVR